MKKILLIVVTVLLSVATLFSLEPLKVAYYTTNTGAQTVHVEIKDYSSGSTLFVGENFSLTPNSNGIVIVNIQDHIGPNGDLSGINASTINTSVTVDVYVGTTLHYQHRLDNLIFDQASTTVFDNSGDFNPPSTSSSLGTDPNRWQDAFVGSNTLHVGPNNGMTGGTEMTLSYDEVNNKGVIAIDGTTSFEARVNGITIPNLPGVGNRNIGVDGSGNVVVNNTPSVTAGNGLTLTTNTLDVGGSATIIANADDVEVNSSGTTNQVLLSSGTVGTAATYGALPLGDANAVSGTLPVARGGTGAATLATGNFLQGNGTGAVTATKAVPTGDVVGTNDAQTLTNKTIDSDNNTITNIVNADIKTAAGIDATKLADGSVTSTELQYINTVTSNVQTQLDGKEANLPNQTGNSGNFLTTDGSNLSWGSIPAGVFTINGANNKVYRNDADDDFIFGDDDLNWTSGTESKMYFDNSKGAFRVGAISNSNWDTDSLGDYSFATGLNTKAIGNYSTAMGSYTTSSGSFSTAMGKQTTASGYVSTAMGEITTASGSRSTAMGRNTTASGYASTAMGEITTASGDHSTAIGISTTASGDNSIAMGRQTTAKSLGETVVGYWNTDYTPDTDGATQWNATDRLFVIGNGAYGSPSDAMIVLKNGDTEISGQITTGAITLPNTDGTNGQVLATDGNGNVSWTTPSGGGAFTSASGVTKANNLSDDFLVGDATMDNPSGVETKMFFDDSKGAFRAGNVIDDKWDDVNVGFYSTALGSFTTASGGASVAMGFQTIASGGGSTTMGNLTIASGDNSTAMGSQTNASGTNSTAMGLQTTASGSSTTAMGRSTIADEGSSVAMGEYNDNTITGELLTVGNGTSNAARSNAIEVYKNGDVVIPALGDGSTTQNLQVNSDGKLVTGGGGGGGLPEVTVLTKSSDQVVSLPTFVNITDITASLDASSVYQIKGLVAISFTSFDKSPYIKLDGLPTSGVVMLETHDKGRNISQIVNTNEFLEEFQLFNGTSYFPIDGIFQTSSSGTFNLQLRADDDPFTVTDDTFFILTKIK